jgi:hypothetical protein
MDNLGIKNILNFVTSKDDKDLLEHYGGKGKGKGKSKKMKKKKSKKKKKKKKKDDEGDAGDDAGDDADDDADDDTSEYGDDDSEDGEDKDDSESERPGFFARMFGSKSPKTIKGPDKIKRKLRRLSQEIYKNKSIISSIVDENPELADFVEQLQE